jgi:outer membrane protein insertion porin family
MMRSIRSSIWMVVLLCGFFPEAAAQVLEGIEIRGNKRVESDAIQLVVKSQPGKPLSAEAVAADIKAIFGLGYFDDVRAEVENAPSGKKLIFVVSEKPAVASIKYSGNNEIDIEKIKEVVDIQPLSVLDIGKIKKNAEKIHDLYVEKGFYLADVTYELKSVSGNQADLTFVIDEHAKVQVKRISFMGNVKIADDDLKGIMATKEGGFFSFLTSSGTYKEEFIKRDQYMLSDYYYNHGYINVKVGEPIIEISRDRGSLFITFAIEEGEQYRFGNVSFSGGLLVDDKQLLATIKKVQAAGGAGLVLSKELEHDIAEGHNPSEVNALTLAVLADLHREVEERIDQSIWEENQPPRQAGEPLRERLRSEILQQLKSRVLKELMAIPTGEIFNRMQLNMSMLRVQEVYKDRGYAYAEVVPNVSVDNEARVVDIVFSFQSGAKVYIERIELGGNVKTRDKVIRRQMRVYEGELYSGSGLETSKRRINSLGFFEKVDISEKKGSGPDRIVLKVEVKERSTGTFQIGVGFSSVENLIGTAQIAQHNLFGRGQTLSLMAQLSSMRQYFSLQFIDPYFLDTNWSLAFSLYSVQLDYLTFLREAKGGDIDLGYEIFDDWRLSVTYKLEKVDVSSETRAGSGTRLTSMFSSGFTSSLQLILTWDTRDNKLFPTAGHLLRGSIEHASSYTFSQNDFTRFSGIARWYFPIIWGIVLKTNLQIGYITSSSSRGVPISEKYFLGGIYNVRGFEPRSIGPPLCTLANGWEPGSYLTCNTYGGDKELWGNIELEFPIVPQVNIRGVFFLDSGNAYGENENFFTERYSDINHSRETWLGLYWSWGFGFRWFSPIGPLRFEWGLPITRRPGDENMLFEFTIGNFF